MLLRDAAERARLAELAPHARHVAVAAVVIAVVMPGEMPDWETHDQGRLAERMLIAAEALGLGAGIGWVTPKYRDGVAALLELTPPAYVRTMVSVGHPTREALQPRSGPGQARKPLSELIVGG